MTKKPLLGKVRIRTKIIVPTIIILVLSNLISVFTSAYKMDDLAKSNAKAALNQLTDSIFLNLRTAMNTGDSTVIEDAEEKARKHIKGLEKFTVARSQDMIELFSPQLTYTTDEETLKVFASKKENILESYENGEHYIRSLRPMVATNECLYCHVNQKEGDVIGVLDLTFNLKESDLIINDTVNNLILQAIVALIFVTLFMTWVIRSATKPIDVFQNGLEKFFQFINKEKKEVDYIDGYSNDEIEELVRSVNKNIDIIVGGVNKDELMLQTAKEICNKASIGDFNGKIEVEAHNPTLNDVKDIINTLISSVDYNMKRIEKVLNAYEKNDFTTRINSKGNTVGTLKEIFHKVDSLGETLGNNSKTNLLNGQKLQEDATELKNKIANIEGYLTQQNTELGKSVLELSQVTKDIRKTTQDTVSMADYTKNVTQSVTVGQKLAFQTAEQMDEIASQVTSIKDAISIIDQIAFQTNILSLNAAVEAATAGEAGKGFAVVAQEVRNLANRSADAAKEIQAIVEKATNKAIEGKNVSDSMAQGYNVLNDHINATVALIEQISNASQNQQKTIESINTNMEVVQKYTDVSAQMAQEANEVATLTSDLATMIVNEANQKKF